MDNWKSQNVHLWQYISKGQYVKTQYATLSNTQAGWLFCVRSEILIKHTLSVCLCVDDEYGNCKASSSGESFCKRKKSDKCIPDQTAARNRDGHAGDEDDLHDEDDVEEEEEEEEGVCWAMQM